MRFQLSSEELDELSLEFIDAYKDIFGWEMFLVPLDRSNTNINELYGESSKKFYDFENKVPFYGIFRRQLPYLERGEIYGRENYDLAEVSVVSKQLRDAGVYVIDQSSIIEIFHKDGSRKLYNIVGDYGTVQLREEQLVTKIIVSEITEDSRTNYDNNDPAPEKGKGKFNPITGAVDYD